MLYRALLRFFLLLTIAAAGVVAQPKHDGPMTLAELRGILTRAEESDESIEPTNRELIAAIEERGVDFVLTPEEEWALKLREASDELLDAIRQAVDPAEREFRLKVKRQQDLYLTFAQNFSRYDLTSKNTALYAGREFVAEYSADPNVTEIVTFIKRQIPSLERSVQMLQRREEMMERQRVQNLYRNSILEQNRRNRAQPPAAQTNAPAAQPKNNSSSTPVQPVGKPN